MQQGEENQRSLLIRVIEARNKAQRMSHHQFDRLYGWAIVVSTILIGWQYSTRPDLYAAIYALAYLLGVLVSWFSFRLYMRYCFRNLLGVLTSALFVPLLIAKSLTVIYMKRAYGIPVMILLLCLLYFMMLGIYLLNWRVLVPLAKIGRGKALGKLMCFQLRRAYLPGHQPEPPLPRLHRGL